MSWITLIVISLALTPVILGRQRPPSPPEILKHEQKLQDNGNFFFNIETENGITQKEVGDSNVRKGTYKYQSPEGEWVEMTYIADKNGFRVFGNHVPKFVLPTKRAMTYRKYYPQTRRKVVRRKVVKKRKSKVLPLSTIESTVET